MSLSTSPSGALSLPPDVLTTPSTLTAGVKGGSTLFSGTLLGEMIVGIITDEEEGVGSGTEDVEDVGVNGTELRWAID